MVRGRLAAAAFAIACLKTILVAHETRADLMQQLVVTAFPELTGPDVTCRWRFWPQPVAEIFRGRGATPPGFPMGAALTAEMTSHGEQMWQVPFSGEMVNELANHRLYEALTAHSAWSLDDLAQWLTNDGAVLGPARELQVIAALDLPRFDSVFGALKVAQVDFSWRFGRPEAGALNIRPPLWRVALRPTARSVVRCYVFLLEPYRARVRTIMTSPEVCGPAA